MHTLTQTVQNATFLHLCGEVLLLVGASLAQTHGQIASAALVTRQPNIGMPLAPDSGGVELNN
jgi:hypothetical protein